MYCGRQRTGTDARLEIPAGCRDEQTSADVHDVSSFGLPPDCGPGGAGGACTNAMMLALTENPNPTWTDLLERMRQILKEKRFTQVPQLASSKPIDLTAQFDLTPGNNRPKKALFIGINYIGQQGELNGCHNDVIQMKQFIETQGFDAAEFRVLMDDGENIDPTAENVLDGLRWLVDGAQAGDALFMHYSGHGGSMPDDNGDEADGMDETLVPVDYQSAGQIRDDIIFEELVAKLPAGVSLKVVMDCCHSGSILDLPYSFQANDANAEAGYPSALPANGNFDWGKAFKVGKRLFEMYKSVSGLRLVKLHAARRARPFCAARSFCFARNDGEGWASGWASGWRHGPRAQHAPNAQRLSVGWPGRGGACRGLAWARWAPRR